MQTQTSIEGHLSPELAQLFLEGLPEHIRQGLENRAKAIDYPVWAVIEMAIDLSVALARIAGYLDEESISFVDCKPTVDCY